LATSSAVGKIVPELIEKALDATEGGKRETLPRYWANPNSANSTHIYSRDMISEVLLSRWVW
jgi:hypothetical protein